MRISSIFSGQIDKMYYVYATEGAEAVGSDGQEFYPPLGKTPAERAAPVVQNGVVGSPTERLIFGPGSGHFGRGGLSPCEKA